MRLAGVMIVLIGLAGCAVPGGFPAGGFPGGPGVERFPPSPPSPPVILSAAAPGERPSPPEAARNFAAVVRQVQPVAESLCRARTRSVNCEFQIVVDTRPGLPPNAFQTLDRTGRPVVGFTVALIEDARNADELAFVLGHEAAHHIAGHIPRQRDSATTGAILAGILAEAGGADATTIRSVQEIGAAVGSRRYSRDFELEADALGTEIAFLAGYDPLRGAEFFSRLPDPGDQFLGSHPPNAQRQELVRRTHAALIAAY